MALVRKLLLAVAVAGAVYGVQACSTETELNPQPLPPEDPRNPSGVPADETSDKQGGTSGGGTSSGSSGSSGGPNAGAGDAGPDADASDGGGG